MSKLENFKYIDDNKLKKKFEITNILENTTNILDNHYKNTLKDFSPEPATFAFEEKRQNYDSVGKLNIHYYGRRNDKEPFQNDLFLGFTDKDPRSIHNGPLMGKYQEQIWSRKDDFKYSFKDDTDNSVPTSAISESKMQKNKKMSYKGFKERYKNFEESNDAWTPGFKPINSKNSKVFLHDVDDTLPDLTKIKDMKNRRDVINEISLQALPIGWNSVPDQKYKIARYTKLLSQINLKDINILKNKNQQEKDSKENELNTEQKLLKKIILATENFKNKKKTNFNNQDIIYKISKNNQNRSTNKNKEFLKNKEILNTSMDDKKNKLIDLLNTKIFSNKDYLNLNTILYKSISSNNKSYINKGNNKELNNKTIKDKNDILNEILYKSLKSNNLNNLNKGNNKEFINKKSNITMINNNNSEFLYKNNDINNDKLQKNNKTYEILNYATIAPSYFTNNYDSVQSSLEKKINSYDLEKYNHHRKPNNNSNEVLNSNHYENDMSFKESGFKNRKNGIFGSKYNFKDKDYETNMVDGSLNDVTSFKFKNNIFKK